MFRRGQILLAILPIFALAVGATVVLITAGQFTFRAEETSRLERDAATIADAGIARAMACLQATDTSTCGGRVGTNYTGERDIAVGNGTVTITMTTIDAQRRRVRAAAAIPDATRARATAARSAELRIDVSPIGLAYGAQAGDGGISMGNNSTIDGSVYSNGTISGGQGTRVTGDAIVANTPLGVPSIAAETYTGEFVFGNSAWVADVGQPFTAPTSGILTAVSLRLRRINNPLNGRLLIMNHYATWNTPGETVLAEIPFSADNIPATADWVTFRFPTPMTVQAGTKYWIVIDFNATTNAYWAVSTDMTPGAKYTYSYTSNMWRSVLRTFAHRVWIGVPNTALDGVRVTRTVRAFRATNTQVSGDVTAYVVTDATIGGSIIAAERVVHSTIGGNVTTEAITTSTVGGTLRCESVSSTTVGGARLCPLSVAPPIDPTPAAFPITNDQVTQWKADAVVGGTTGTFNPTSGTVTRVGPIRIEGDLVLDNNQTLIVTGTIHVTGNMDIGQNGSVILDSAYGGNSGMIVVDGTINLENNGAMRGSGTPGSYLLLVSLSTQSSDSDPAIDIHNSANGAMFYAPNGSARLHNTTTISQLTAKKIRMDNGAVLRYERGFLDARFTSGPTAGWTPVLGTWKRE